MKTNILLLVAFACILRINCYKLKDSNYPIPDYLRFKVNSLYSSSNKQSSLYDDTLAALEEAAAEDNAESSDENYDANDFESEDSTPPRQNNYYDDSIKTDARDEESESHSSLGSGFQYVSGGAGEGKQHLTPDGHMTNKDEVKSDEDLPAYCHPPNPCPVDYKGDDCDSRPYEEFTSEYSKRYQEQQNCMCDDDHNDCHKSVRSKLGVNSV
jgi:hypothetical protein